MTKNTISFKRSKGFTLVEMVPVMLVVGIMAVVTGPQIVSSLQSFKLNAAAGQMLADVRYARELALSRHATYGIEINQAGNYYQIFSLSGNTKTVLTDPLTRKPMTVDFDLLPEYSGVTFGTVDFCQSGGCAAVDLRFDSFGVPADSAGSTMASSATAQISAGGTTRTLTINEQTAFSEIV